MNKIALIFFILLTAIYQAALIGYVKTTPLQPVLALVVWLAPIAIFGITWYGLSLWHKRQTRRKTSTAFVTTNLAMHSTTITDKNFQQRAEIYGIKEIVNEVVEHKMRLIHSQQQIKSHIELLENELLFRNDVLTLQRSLANLKLQIEDLKQQTDTTANLQNYFQQIIDRIYITPQLKTQTELFPNIKINKIVDLDKHRVENLFLEAKASILTAKKFLAAIGFQVERLTEKLRLPLDETPVTKATKFFSSLLGAKHTKQGVGKVDAKAASRVMHQSVDKDIASTRTVPDDKRAVHAAIHTATKMANSHDRRPSTASKIEPKTSELPRFRKP